MQIDTATWKRVTKRIALLEDLIENLNDWNLGVYACLKMLSKRNGSTCGSDPMCVLMLGTNSRPRSLPHGIRSEDIPGFYVLAETMLKGETAIEFKRRQAIMSELRQMRDERLARQGKISPPNGSSSDGGMSLF